MNAFLNKAKASTANVPVVTEEEKVPVVETVTEDGSTGEAFAARAEELAKQESPEMSAAIETAIKGKEDWQGGPIKVLFAMRETYGDDLAGFPVPDETEGNNPDKFTITVTNSSGKQSVKKTSFYTVFADATKEGAAIVKELEYLKLAGDDKAAKQDIPADILELSIDKRAARINQLTGRRSSIKRSYHSAMALYHKMSEIDGMPKVGIDFVWNDENETEVANTTKPIIIWDVPNEGKPILRREFFSIGALLKLKVGKALELGGTLKALQQTVTRNTDGGATGNNGKATEVPPIKTVETFLGRFAEVYRYANEMQYAKDQKDMATLVKFIKAKGSDELTVAIVETEMFLSDLNKQLGLSRKYNELQKAGSDLVSEKAA